MVGADAALWMASLSKLLARARLDCAGDALALARSRAHLYNIAALNPFLVVIDMRMGCAMGYFKAKNSWLWERRADAAATTA